MHQPQEPLLEGPITWQSLSHFSHVENLAKKRRRSLFKRTLAMSKARRPKFEHALLAFLELTAENQNSENVTILTLKIRSKLNLFNAPTLRHQQDSIIVTMLTFKNSVQN